MEITMIIACNRPCHVAVLLTENCYDLVFMLPKNTSGLKVCDVVTMTGK